MTLCPYRARGVLRGVLVQGSLACMVWASQAGSPALADSFVMAAVAPDDAANANAEAAAQAHTAYAQALQALEQQQWVQAELLLERALMFQPEHAEALVQLAILLAQRGRLESAQALLGMLLKDPRTPALHRRYLQALLDNTSTQGSVPLRHNAAWAPLPESRTQMLWSTGYTRNPLGTTSATQLTLTLPDGPVTLALDAPANGSASAITTVALHHQNASGLELYAQAQHASLAQARSAGRLALAGPLGLKNHQWSLGTQRAMDGSTRHSATLVRTLQSNTQVAAGVFYESALARTGWLVRGQRSFNAASRWPLTAWAEYEHGRSGRAPGAVRAGLQVLAPIAPQWQLQGLVHGQADTSGYSRLLKNNLARRLVTVHIELEYRLAQPVLGGHAALSMHGARRWSNLELFDWRDHGVRLSWLQQW